MELTCADFAQHMGIRAFCLHRNMATAAKTEAATLGLTAGRQNHSATAASEKGRHRTEKYRL